MNLRTLSLALLLLLSSCGVLFYSRMTVGAIELTEGAEQQIQLRNLPGSRELVVGLGISNCALRASERRIAILVKNEHGDVVINEDRRLQDFRWTPKGNECAPAFGYIQGEWRERPLNSRGDTCGEPIYTGADYGNGTSFKSRRDGVYTLLVRTYGGHDAEGSVGIELMDDGPFVSTGCPQ